MTVTYMAQARHTENAMSQKELSDCSDQGKHHQGISHGEQGIGAQCRAIEKEQTEGNACNMPFRGLFWDDGELDTAGWNIAEHGRGTRDSGQVKKSLGMQE